MSLTPTGTFLGPLLTGTGGSVTFTAPAGVSGTDLCVLVLGTANSWNEGQTFAAGGFTARVSSPQAGNNCQLFVFTRLGGVGAGSTVTITGTANNTLWVAAAWYATGGRDVAVVGPVNGRFGTSSTQTVIAGYANATAGQDVIVVATERTSATDTAITGWSPLTPTQDVFGEATGAAASFGLSHYVGHYVTQPVNGETGDLTATYSTGSGNGAGVLLGLAAPSNAAPTVNAGPDQTDVEPWTAVTLTGTDSDSDGTIASRSWAQTGGPAVTLSGSGATRTFEAPGTIAGTTLTFTYTATDNGGATDTDTMTVAVLPVTERAVIGGVEVPMRVRDF